LRNSVYSAAVLDLTASERHRSIVARSADGDTNQRSSKSAAHWADSVQIVDRAYNTIVTENVVRPIADALRTVARRQQHGA